jgi:hypothetical protein
MHVHETRVAIAATLAGLVLATGIGAVAAPTAPPPPAAPVTASQLVDAPVSGLGLNQAIDAADGG